MLTIFKDSKRAGTLTTRLKLTTKDPKLRELIERARTEGLAHWFKPNIPDRPRMPLSDGVRRAKAGEEFLTELRRELRIHGYEVNTTKTRRAR